MAIDVLKSKLGEQNELCITLTCKEQVQDIDEINSYFDKFFRKSEYTVLIKSEKTGKIMNKHKTEIYERE